MWSSIKSLFRKKAVPKPLASSDDVAKVICSLFVNHGLPCRLEGGRILAESGLFVSHCQVTNLSENQTTYAIRLDVFVAFDSGEEVIESFVGIGENRYDAIGNAIKYFCDGSFHVIYSSVSGTSCSHCELETWTINGTSRRVYLGPLTTRGDVSFQNTSLIDWFKDVEVEIKALQLSAGRHWLRFFHAEMGDEQSTSEVLLDNHSHPEIQKKLEVYNWPKTDGYYSVRIFLMINDDTTPPDSLQ